VVPYSVANPHHFETDMDPTVRFDADPDPNFQVDADPVLIKVMRICDHWSTADPSQIHFEHKRLKYVSTDAHGSYILI
jgi:hypothetical protein